MARAAQAAVAARVAQEARVLLAKPFIPGWLYRAMGVYGWSQQAKLYGVAGKAKRRPYIETNA